MGEAGELDKKDQILSIVNGPDYRYLNDKDNDLAENGVDLESAPDILIESAMKKLTNFDAFVLIHPDYISIKKRQLYKKTIEGVVKRCLEIDKPVICLRFDENADSGLDPLIFTETTAYPSIKGDGDDPGVCQQEVDGIVAILGKDPGNLRLAWGGTAADMCVAQWRDNTCRVTKPPFESFTMHIGRKLKNPISYGESLPEVTSY